MTGEITNAIVQETLAMPDFTDGGGEGSVMLKTDFKMSDIGSYGMPFVLAEILEGEDSDQMLGGVKRMAWKIGLNSYGYQPDITGDDKTGYTTQLLNVIDRITDHFNAGRLKGWLTPGMTTILNNYGFRFTFSGISPADPLDGDGLIMGYKVIMDSVSVDTSTGNIQSSSSVVTTVTQINNPPY